MGLKKFLINTYVSMISSLVDEIEDVETKKQLLITKNLLLREMSKK